MYLRSAQRVIIMLLTENTENIFKSSELLLLLIATHLPCLLTKCRLLISSYEILKCSKTLLGTKDKMFRLHLDQKSQEVTSL